MSISFDLIPSTLRTPAVVAEFSAIRAQSGVSIQPHRVLLVGQRIAVQTRATGTLVLAGQPDDGDSYLISDGVLAVAFEFDDDASVVPSTVLKGVTIGVDLATTCANLLAAINAHTTLAVTAISVTTGNTVNLRADLAGTTPNVAITEPVNVSTNLSDTGMTGGVYTPSGTGTSLVAYRIGSAQEAANLWGAGSHLHRQALAFFRNNSFTECFGIALEDALGGTPSTATATFTGPATAAGTIAVYVGGNRYPITVASGDSATVIAANLATLVSADTAAPFTASPSSGVVTFTAKNAGTVGNFLDLRHSHNAGEVLPAGTGLTLTTFSGGGGGVDLTLAFSAIGDEWFTEIVSVYGSGTNLSNLATELEARWGPLRAIEAAGFVSAVGDVTAAGSTASVVNNGHLCLVGAQGSPTWTVEIAAATAAVVSFYASIDPARPWNGLELVGVLAPSISSRWNLSQRSSALYLGVSTLRVENGATVLDRVISTYRTNAVGAADTAFLDMTSHYTLAYLRFDLVTILKLKYPRAKIASDDLRLAAGQAIVTPAIMRAELIARAALWESLGLVEDLEGFKADLIVERDPSDPTRLNFQLPPNLVNPLVVIAGRVTFIL